MDTGHRDEAGRGPLCLAPVIARVWTARATSPNAAAYREHFECDVIPSVRGVEGYAGGSLLIFDRSEVAEVIVITRWCSLDAIRGFAGEDIDVAVVADAARRLLLSWDERVRHYTVAVDDRIDPN